MLHQGNEQYIYRNRTEKLSNVWAKKPTRQNYFCSIIIQIFIAEECLTSQNNFGAVNGMPQHIVTIAVIYF